VTGRRRPAGWLGAVSAPGYDCTVQKNDVGAKIPEGAPNLDAVKRSVESLRQLQQRIRKRGRGRSALSAAEVRAAIAHGRK